MKIPSVGWAFFGLAVVILAGYVLNRGIYIGSYATSQRHSSGMMFYGKTCRHLHFTGITESSRTTSTTPEEAATRLCRMFDD
jgi:hypothetical protein